MKKDGNWKVAWIDIHNQMPPFDTKPGQPLETDYPPPDAINHSSAASTAIRPVQVPA